MEKKVERVLAYKLSRSLDNKELEEVSGGGKMCNRPSAGVTVNGGIRTTDVTVDLVVDW